MKMLNEYHCENCNEDFSAEINCQNPFCPVCGDDSYTKQGHQREWGTLKQDQRIEELEFQAKTAVMRGLIEMYDQGILDAEGVHDLTERYLLKNKPPRDEWLDQVSAIWNEWAEVYEDLVDSDDYHIDRIREAIGMPKPTKASST